ncbi:acyl-CoA dehydrogenase family protein [Yinghuangia aomiensis]|uniref:Acyl-CoA dehydrogenase family protein n=1 Tax=Yinghuangia aomiensis TaxID=676205 RepID=A0ABP9IDE1_9ACTN
MDAAERDLLADALRKTMTAATGPELDAALEGLGWHDMLAEIPEQAVPLVFRLLGETGAHAPLINDVLRHAAGFPTGGTLLLPCAGGAWLVWERDGRPGTGIDPELPLHTAADDDPTALNVQLPPAALAAGRRALGWWLLGSGRAMLALARQHVLDRAQFGRSLASFQAVRHRLAETLVALDGAEAALLTAGESADAATGPLEASDRRPDDYSDDELAALLGKAAAGQAALTAARHCQQLLGGIGFTTEHDFHRHVRRVLALDTLLGSTRELTREAGAHARREGRGRRLVEL